jgi:hypothetical protein
MAQTNNKQYFAKIVSPRYAQNNPVLHVPQVLKRQGSTGAKGATYVPPELAEYIVIGYWPIDYVN